MGQSDSGSLPPLIGRRGVLCFLGAVVAVPALPRASAPASLPLAVDPKWGATVYRGTVPPLYAARGDVWSNSESGTIYLCTADSVADAPPDTVLKPGEAVKYFREWTVLGCRQDGASLV